MRIVKTTVLLAALWAQTAAAETRALLIGVSDYDETIGIADLRGPANDVRLMREVLAGRGVADIRVLADGLEGAARPTRAAILDELAALARDSGAGDLAVIHVSGHGTRQPDGAAEGDPGDERDGYDEVLLPADTGRAAPGARSIPNAIVDDEIGRAVDAIRATGADVWLIVDTCHSGSAVRAAGTATATRFVDPAALGLALGDLPALGEGGVAEVAARAPALAAEGTARGGLVAFYAAQATELAREIDFAAVAGDGAEAPAWYGFFTARLAEGLRSAGGASYRQLFQSVLGAMNATPLPSGGGRQTPFWEGDLIDAPVLGSGAAGGLVQFPVEGRRLGAGLVQGVERGAVLALVGDAMAPGGARLGYAQVEAVSALSATLRPVASTCVPARERLCAAEASLPDQARFARPEKAPVSLVIRLSRPFPLGPESVAAETAANLESALERAVAASDGRFRLVETGHDLEVGVADGRLWIGSRASLGGLPAGVSWGPGDPETLSAVLARIAYAGRWIAVAEALAAEASPFRPNPVEVAVDVAPSRAAALSPAPPADPAAECAGAAGAGAAPLSPGARLKQCDAVRITASAPGGGAYDVNHLYIDASACVWATHARIDGRGVARTLGEPMTLCSDCGGPRPVAGDEVSLTLVTPALDNADQINLVGRVENCLGGPTRSAGGPLRTGVGPLAAFLDEVLAAPATRGRLTRALPSAAWVVRTDWTVLPRAVALAEAGALPRPPAGPALPPPLGSEDETAEGPPPLARDGPPPLPPAIRAEARRETPPPLPPGESR